MDSLKVNQGPRRENKGLLVSKGGRYRARAMSDYENDPNFKGRVLVSLKPYVVRKVIVTMLSQMDISDRRQLGKVRFSAPSLIFTVSLAYLCGSRSACSMGKFWEHNRDFLAEVIPDFPHDLYVSHDTIKRTIENVVFENYAQFFTRFTQALLYESLNDLHLTESLPEEQRWLFSIVLQEHSLSEQEQQKQSVRKQLAPGISSLVRPYNVLVFGCSSRLNSLSPEALSDLKFHDSILTVLRNYRFSGSACLVHFQLGTVDGTHFG